MKSPPVNTICGKIGVKLSLGVLLSPLFGICVVLNPICCVDLCDFEHWIVRVGISQKRTN